MINKKQLNERDICTKFITPALRNAGWDELLQIREEVRFTKGRVIVRDKIVTRGRDMRADYLLSYDQNMLIAVIEAKDNNHDIGDGLQQALEYAEVLDIPFAFSSNGDGFIFHDRTELTDPRESHVRLEDFPSPNKLWKRYCKWKGILEVEESVVLQPYYEDEVGKAPRYYQQSAINAAVTAIAKGQDRILLVMATGTGKTFTAFQIVWRLWKSGVKKRILFLADRNILIDQAMVNDFRPFGAAMAKLSTRSKTIERVNEAHTSVALAVDKNRRVDTAYEVYLGLYQAITGPEDRKKIYRALSRDFFDLIVIDECHRGSAADDSAWREILEYFSSATQIGLTATPKETEYVSNIAYFGEPIYTYSLKEGIRDGFLAPYKVIKYQIDHDVEGYKPAPGQTDRDGEELEDRVYTSKEFDDNLVIDDRTKLVARKVTEFLKESGNRYQKTIVFCVDQEHASRMRRALINENADLVAENHRYVMRITGSDTEGVNQLDNFIDPESKYPVIVTTSRLLSTGVDAQTCSVIVIDRHIESMTEFKQILGRGTRINEDAGKYYFTVIDFRKATDHFSDPTFDGAPVQIYEPREGDSIVPPADEPTHDEEGNEIPPEPMPDETTVYDPKLVSFLIHKERRSKIYVDGVGAEIVAETVEYLDQSGQLVTESLRDYAKKAILQRYPTLADFSKQWKAAPKKQTLLDEIEAEGLPLVKIGQELGLDLDAYDLIANLGFDAPTVGRNERAKRAREALARTSYAPLAREVLDALLVMYVNSGIQNIDDIDVLRVQPLSSLGTPLQLVKAFGTRDDFEAAARSLQSSLYSEGL